MWTWPLMVEFGLEPVLRIWDPSPSFAASTNSHFVQFSSSFTLGSAKTLKQINNNISYNREILQNKCQWDGKTGLRAAGSWVPPLKGKPSLIAVRHYKWSHCQGAGKYRLTLGKNNAALIFSANFLSLQQEKISQSYLFLNSNIGFTFGWVLSL